MKKLSDEITIFQPLWLPVDIYRKCINFSTVLISVLCLGTKIGTVFRISAVQKIYSKSKFKFNENVWDIINTSKTITSAFFFIPTKFYSHIIWLTGTNILKISQGTKISTTKFDRSKIKLVLNLIRLRYSSHLGSVHITGIITITIIFTNNLDNFWANKIVYNGCPRVFVLSLSLWCG